MRWILKILAGILAVCMLLYILHMYSFLLPLLLHPQKSGLHTLLGELLVLSKTQNEEQNYVVIFGMMIAMTVVAYLHSLFQRTSTTYGSARHASWFESGHFASPGSVVRAVSQCGRWICLGCTIVWTFASIRTWSAVLTVITNAQLHMTQRSFFVIGKYKGRLIALTEQQQQEHLLLCAPTGAGKTSLCFVPNLLRERGDRSLFIADLKDELYRKTVGAVSHHHKVVMFAPTKPLLSHGYNPLAHIKTVEDAFDFADCWVENTGTGKEPFWPNSSKLLITAIALHLRDVEPNASLSRLSDLVTSSYKTVKHLLMTTASADARLVGEKFLENMEDNERLVSSFMSDLGNRFQMLASPNIRQVTATNELDFEMMSDEAVAFYLCVPRSATRRLRPLLACLTLQMFNAWERPGTYGKVCYMDEFTKLGRVPGMADFISMARDLKIAVLMAIQDFSQMDEMYGVHDAKTIRATTVTHLVLGGVDLEVSRYYSEKIGKATTQTETRHMSGTGMNEQVNWTQGETGRSLLTPDEIRRLPKNTVLMLHGSYQPLLVKANPYYKDRRLARLADIPYHPSRVHVQPEPPDIASSTSANFQDVSSTPQATQKDDDEQHFLQA